MLAAISNCPTSQARPFTTFDTRSPIKLQDEAPSLPKVEPANLCMDRKKRTIVDVIDVLFLVAAGVLQAAVLTGLLAYTATLFWM